tara:strand:- start:292 stop:540 length:249 start_codon:yes stop_codon:yes gene_type:complete
MPYIKQERRKEIDPTILNFCPKDAGDLNYVVTVMIDNFINWRGENYKSFNEMIGALECCKQEYYRRIIAPYEDEKIKENGDV